VQLDGWVLTGGVFTNNNALDTVFKIAATAGTESDATRRMSLPLAITPSGAEERVMGEAQKGPEAGAETVSLTFHKSELTKRTDEIAALRSTVDNQKAALTGKEEELVALRAKLTEAQQHAATAQDERATARAAANRLEADARPLNEELRSLRSKLTETEAKLKEQTDVNVSAEVRALITDAVAAKVSPGLFEGWDSKETTPAAWLASHYASLDAFKEQVRRFKSVASGKGMIVTGDTKSGHDPAKTASDSDERSLTAEEERRLAEMGLGVDYGGVSGEKEARRRFQAAQKKSA
jgi:hypothetical protein